MELSGHGGVLGSPTGALQAQAMYGEVRRRLYAQEKEEVKEQQKEFIELMSVDSMNAVDDAYQTRYADLSKEFIDYGQRKYKDHDLRIPMDVKMEMMGRKRELLQQKGIMEASYKALEQDRKLYYSDVQAGTYKFDREGTQAAFNTFMKENKESRGEKIYQNALVPSFMNVGDASAQLGETSLRKPAYTSTVTQVSNIAGGKTRQDKVTVNSHFGGESMEDIWVARTQSYMNAINNNEAAIPLRRTTKNLLSKAENLTGEKFGDSGDEWSQVVAMAKINGTGEIKYTDDGRMYMTGELIDAYSPIRILDARTDRFSTGYNRGKFTAGTMTEIINDYVLGGEKWDEGVISISSNLTFNLGELPKDTYRIVGEGDIRGASEYYVRAISPHRVSLMARRTVLSLPAEGDVADAIRDAGPLEPAAINSRLRERQLITNNQEAVYTNEQWEIVTYEDKAAVEVKYDIFNEQNEITANVKAKLPDEKFQELKTLATKNPKDKEDKKYEVPGPNKSIAPVEGKPKKWNPITKKIEW